ncbi:hypothetical protein PoB_000839500 [Plakobranchus ocellatus]|uniref:Uncharacterized protein n=1 Tax=Plakobranchus ocellatus TaxID=259542 RepID=A0AAV3YFP4_9GAST|nr:hypothetical protein PoB_000839500 [Plakobranchus ocellatus]
MSQNQVQICLMHVARKEDAIETSSSSSSSSSSDDEVGALSSHHKSHSSNRKPTPTQKEKRGIRGLTTMMHSFSSKLRRRSFSSDTAILSRHEKAGPSRSTGSIEQKSTKSANDEAHRRGRNLRKTMRSRVLSVPTYPPSSIRFSQRKPTLKN